MAPKSAPFQVVVHYTEKKSSAEMQELYVNFYLNAVQSTLANSNLPKEAKEAVMNRLCSHFSEAESAA